MTGSLSTGVVHIKALLTSQVFAFAARSATLHWLDASINRKIGQGRGGGRALVQLRNRQYSLALQVQLCPLQYRACTRIDCIVQLPREIAGRVVLIVIFDYSKFTELTFIFIMHFSHACPHHILARRLCRICINALTTSEIGMNF